MHLLSESDLWINGGFFVLRSKIFDYLHAGEELVAEPFQRLIREQKLVAHRHDGFWRPMDTFKDKMALDAMYESGVTPWEIWKETSSLSDEIRAGSNPQTGD
jgi:glucose-1-phosphate cytidylyltransferase